MAYMERIMTKLKEGSYNPKRKKSADVGIQTYKSIPEDKSSDSDSN